MQKVFYRTLIAAALIEKDGTPFEDWFVEVARRAWGPDFEPVRAQGKHGDLKCDGHRISEKGIYQCYAPLRSAKEKIEDKIATDFSGALAIWQNNMKVWQIVINDRRGLQAKAKEEVEKLRKKYPQIAIHTFGPIEIEKLTLSLSLDGLGAIFGVYLSHREAELLRVTFSDIAKVVDSLGGTNPPPTLASLSPPAEDKAEHNKLDPEIRILLTRGEVLAQRVEQYFQDTGRVEQGEKIGEQLKQLYRDMKSSGYDQNSIFFEFADICGGINKSVGTRMAVLAVVTYYFNRCDIFENAGALPAS